MLACVAWAPWWGVVIGMLFFSYVYDRYLEVIIWGIMMDATYSISTGVFGHMHYSLFALVLWLVADRLKARFRRTSSTW